MPLKNSNQKCPKRIAFAVELSLLFFLFACSANQSHAPSPPTAVTKDSVVTLTESGQISYINFAVLSAPGSWRMEYRIKYMPPEGSFVNKGDTVVIFDTQQVKSKLDEAQGKLDIEQARLNETQEKNDLAMDQKQKALQRVQMDLLSIKLKLKNSRFESDAVRKDMELQLQKTILNVQRAKQDIKAQRIISQKKEALVRLAILQAKNDIARAKKMYSDMYLVTPRSGMVIYEKQGWGGSGEKVKIGDSVYPQTSLISIPDLSAMKAVIRLNEVDRPQLRNGLQALIRVEAYPDTLFSGRVNFISRIVNRSNDLEQVKTFNVDVRIDSKENFRLKPGLSAQVQIFADTLHRVFRIPSFCLLGNPPAYRVRYQGKMISVKLVRLNDGYAFVKGRLKTGMILTPLRLFKNSAL